MRLTTLALTLALPQGAQAARLLDGVPLLGDAQAAPAPATPKARAALGKTVRASWYGGGERLNRRTSTGEVFRPMGHTAAHRTLPFGTMLRVTAAATGRSTVVRVNDRGPAAATGRSLDLSRGAAADIGLIAMGEGRVLIEVLH